MNKTDKNIINSDFENRKEVYTKGFDVPDGYFEKLTNNIQSKIASGRQNSFSNVIFSYKYVLSFIVLVFVIFSVFNNGETKDSSLALTDSDIVEFIVEDIENVALTDDLLIENIDFSDSYDELLKDDYPNDIELSDDEIIDFILEEDDEFEFYL